jgi:3-oxoacyl-[acyl-carrier protein] reductase
MDLKIRGHVAMVTGGGRGIGRGIAHALGAEGCKVVVLDRDVGPAESVAAEIRAAGGEAAALSGDVADPASVSAFTEAALERFGTVHILINNAGFSRDAPITEMTDGQWQEIIGVCLTGPFNCSRAVAPAMIRQKYGRIINIGSRSWMGNEKKANYSAAKAGVIGLSKALAIELGPHGITVNVIAPGTVETERYKGTPNYATQIVRARAAVTVGRLGEPEDIARGVLFYAAKDADYITGDVMHMTGGRFG